MSYYPGQTIEIDVFIEVQPTTLSKRAEPGDVTITVTDPSRWTNGVTIKVGDGDPQVESSELRVASSIAMATGIITLDSALRFAHPAGSLVWRLNDSTVVASVKNAAGTTTPAVSNVSTGRKRVSYPSSVEGKHVIELVSSGAVASSASEEFVVSKDEV